MYMSLSAQKYLSLGVYTSHAHACPRAPGSGVARPDYSGLQIPWNGQADFQSGFASWLSLPAVSFLPFLPTLSIVVL
jgi:hypothetical protein